MRQRPNVYGVVFILFTGAFLMVRSSASIAQARRYRSELRAGGFTNVKIDRSRAMTPQNPLHPPMRFEARDQLGLWVTGFLTENDRNGVEVHIQRFGFDESMPMSVGETLGCN